MEMRRLTSVLALAAGCCLLPSSARAAVITIDVAELEWRVEDPFGVGCESMPEFCTSVFTLKYLWLDPTGTTPAPASIDGTLDVGDVVSPAFGPIALAGSSSLFQFGIPTTAHATVVFELDGPQSIGPIELVKDLFDPIGQPAFPAGATLFQFQYEVEDPVTPVPEPSAGVLTLAGLLIGWRRMRRRGPGARRDGLARPLDPSPIAK